MQVENKNEKKHIEIHISKYLKKIKIFLEKTPILPYIAIGIPLFFLSMMLVAQMKTISNSEEILEGKREAQLADELVNLQAKYDDLKAKYEQNEEVVEEYQNNASTNDTLISSMKEQINKLSLISGATDLKGEGIVIVLTDGVNSSSDSTRTDSLVHDSDLLTVVNELKAAGAEAISINDQRIITNSAIRCAGPVIQVNYQKVAAPFEIKAIGNAQYLESAMNLKNGVADLLKEYGVGVSITRQSNIQIPKYDGTTDFEYAEEDTSK